MPPIPSATSREMDPVGIDSMGGRLSSPRRMMVPLPNWRSICASAVSRALSRSAAATGNPCWVGAFFFMMGVTLRRGSDILRRLLPRCGQPSGPSPPRAVAAVLRQRRGRPGTTPGSGVSSSYPNLCSIAGASPGSVDVGGEVEGAAHGAPDLLGADAVVEGLADRAGAELLDDVVAGEALGVGLAELLVHELPEAGESHLCSGVGPVPVRYRQDPGRGMLMGWSSRYDRWRSRTGSGWWRSA